MFTDNNHWKDRTCFPMCICFLIGLLTCVGAVLILPFLPAVPRLAAGLAMLSLLVVIPMCLVLVNQTDPGVIEPNPSADPAILEVTSGAATQEEKRMKKNERGKWTREVTLPSGELVVERYCETCNIWRPPLASHCDSCGYCMSRFDHHCSVVGACIAERNHRWFVGFLLCAGLACLFYMAIIVWVFVSLSPQSSSTWKSGKTCVVYFLPIAFFVFLIAFINSGCFGLAHLALLCVGSTTKRMVNTHILFVLLEFRSMGCKRWGQHLYNTCFSPVRWKWSVGKERCRLDTI